MIGCAPSASSATHEEFPPYFAYASPQQGVDPRTPLKRTRIPCDMGGEDTQLQTVVNPPRQTVERRRTARPRPAPSSVKPVNASGSTGPPVKGSEPEPGEAATVVVVVAAFTTVLPGEPHSAMPASGQTIGSMVVVVGSSHGASPPFGGCGGHWNVVVVVAGATVVAVVVGGATVV